MKKIQVLSAILMALAFAFTASAAPFTDGNLVVYRHGNGVNALTNTGNAVFLDEYTTNGVLVQSFMMPTNYFGAHSPLIANGTAFADGMISRSQDGRFILVGGYGATLGQITNFSLTSATGIEAPRVIATVDQNGHIDTTTVQTNSIVTGDDIRSAASTDGTNIWSSGGSAGIRYQTRGSVQGTQLTTFNTNTRQVTIASNTLYFTSASGASRIGVLTNGLNNPPITTNGVFINNLPGVTLSNSTSPWAIAQFALAPGSTNIDTIYVADATENAVKKFSYQGGTNWVNVGSISGITGAFGLAGRLNSGGGVELYITGGGATLTGGDNVFHFTDPTGYNVDPAGGINGALIVDGSFLAGKGLRGVVFAPVGSETFPSGDGQLSVGPILGLFGSGMTGCSLTSTQIYSVANVGTNSISWAASCDTNWVTLSPSSGTLTSGGSITVAAAFNANANSLTAGTNTASLIFTNTTVGSSLNGSDTTTRLARLILTDQSIAPSTDFTVAGPPGGVFTPSNKVYTVSNGSTPITLAISKTATWLNLSDTSVSLGACASTNITVSINTGVANALAVGNYADTISFSNATAGSLISARAATLAVGFQYIFDDFSTFTAGNLAPQQGWAQHKTTSANPIQISNGSLLFPAGQTVDGQDIFKDFPLTPNPTQVFCGVSITFSNVPTGPIANFFMALISGNGGTLSTGPFANYRIGVTNNLSGNIALTARTTGQATDQSQVGAFTLSTGVQYRVVLASDPNGTNTTLYVNPDAGSGGAPTSTPYMVHVMGAGASASTGNGGILISQFANATVANPVLSINKLAVSTNWPSVYTFITPVGPPPTDPFVTWQNTYFTPAQLADPTFSGPNADPFGKGFSNTNQFLLGFNPTNSTAYPHILLITNGGPDTTVIYLGANGDNSYVPGVASRVNILEITPGRAADGGFTNNFVAGVTNVLSGGAGTGTVVSVIDSGGATNKPARYYRVRVLLP